MAMYANDVTLVGVYDTGKTLLARLTGSLGCSTEAGTASGKVGSLATEPAFFDIEALLTEDMGAGRRATGSRSRFRLTRSRRPSITPYSATKRPSPAR